MVYVDNVQIPFKSGGRTMKMCHMVADTLDELHSMAAHLGISRRHFQNHTRYPHYDICKSKQTTALQLGAQLADRRTLIEKAKKLRNETLLNKVKQQHNLFSDNA